MRTPNARSLLKSTPVKGAIVGFCATQALDLISTVLYEKESKATRLDEDATRGWLHAYERAALDLGRSAGLSVSRRDAKAWGWRLHKLFGVLGGVGYVAARARKPGIGRWGGLGFGAGFFLVADELLMPLLGLTPGPGKFSWKVHARGAAAHIVYGVAAEMTARALERGEGLIRVKSTADQAPDAKPKVRNGFRKMPAVTMDLPDMGRLA
jgi:hypothetical protein